MTADAREELLQQLANVVGPWHVMAGDSDLAATYREDWTDQFEGIPLAVVSPKSTEEVADTVKTCAKLGISVVPSGGRSITVEAGVFLQTAQEAASDADLIFPLTFGAQGSAMIGGGL
ncbi:FAD-binding oxidoreductase [Sulfitobacter marinus]|uniref:FAD-binding oxidoreductase n=1 Tax=Sulfitobacter marinus TaxID=394264 RepID=UPI00111395FB|nr:FAD-binding oxidoreductase [Sulfitobacter marinus]